MNHLKVKPLVDEFFRLNDLTGGTVYVMQDGLLKLRHTDDEFIDGVCAIQINRNGVEEKMTQFVTGFEWLDCMKEAVLHYGRGGTTLTILTTKSY